MAHNREDDSVLNKLDAAAAPLAKFDAFPKVPSAYKARSESRGFMTIFIMLMTFVLMLNDIGEYFWGWPEYKFEVDKANHPYMFINLDMVVNMPCKCEFFFLFFFWVQQDFAKLKILHFSLKR